ncbi:MAG: hypothetical protein KAT53_06850 [Dehalococcoidia bacterium]|nr:hypothetical protein [Dehalococcoidia bacterium]
MKTLKLDEFVRQYRTAPNIAEKGEGILAAFGYMTFVYHKDHGLPRNEKHVADLDAKDIDRIVQALEAEGEESGA